MPHAAGQSSESRPEYPKLTAQQKSARDLRAEARRKYRASKLSRREDTRRKILVGAIVLAKVERGEFDEKILMKWMDELLSRDDDRQLFGLSTERSGVDRKGERRDSRRLT